MSRALKARRLRVRTLAAGAAVDVARVVVGEVAAGEGPVLARGLVDHRDVRLDALLVHQPVQHLGRAVGRVGGEPFGPQIVALVHPLDHGPGGGDLGLAHGRGRLDVHDDGVIEVDQVVGGVGEEGQALVGAGPSGRRIRGRDELGRRPASPRRRRRRPAPPDTRRWRGSPLRAGRPSSPGTPRWRLASALIRLASTAKPSPPTRPSAMQRRDDRLEQLAQQVALAEAAVAVLREGRVVGHVAVQPQPAEPAIGEVEMNLLAEPPLGPDAEAVAHQQHADQQLGVDRGAADRAVEWREMRRTPSRSTNRSIARSR